MWFDELGLVDQELRECSLFRKLGARHRQMMAVNKFCHVYKEATLIIGLSFYET